MFITMFTRKLRWFACGLYYILGQMKPIHAPYHIYEGESNENLKSVIKIRNTARLSSKLATVILKFEEWPTGGSTMEERNTTAQQ